MTTKPRSSLDVNTALLLVIVVIILGVLGKW